MIASGVGLIITLIAVNIMLICPNPTCQCKHRPYGSVSNANPVDSPEASSRLTRDISPNVV